MSCANTQLTRSEVLDIVVEFMTCQNNNECPWHSLHVRRSVTQAYGKLYLIILDLGLLSNDMDGSNKPEMIYTQ